VCDRERRARLINGADNAIEMGAVPLSVAPPPRPWPCRLLGGGRPLCSPHQCYQANAYSLEDLQLLSTVANQAVSIQNGRLFGETQRLARTQTARH
jgi:hypothetical protein